MHPYQVRPGESYLAKVGGWIFDVERIHNGRVFYTVCQTGQLCLVKLLEFAPRLDRALQPEIPRCTRTPR